MRTEVRLLNDNWKFAQANPPKIAYSDTEEWLPAEVPGHVHLDLMKNGIIPNPFHRMYERGVVWVDDADWIYKRSFSLKPGEEDGRLILRFKGLDTMATITLNDVELGKRENMFIPHEFDITDIVRKEDNELNVQFTSAKRIAEKRMKRFFDERKDKAGNRSGWYPRSFIRKAQYMFGWDWGPTFVSCGIWQDVELISIPVAQIVNWRYESRLDQGRAFVDVTLEIESGKALPAVLALNMKSDGDVYSFEESIDLKSGNHLYSLELEVDDPDLWYPHTLGEPNLYGLSIDLTHQGSLLDRLSKKVGIREVELVTEEDDSGESFYFRVNGESIFAKGANWIPADSFPSRVSRNKYTRLLEMAREANMNMVRIWGGGIYETEDFYELCDELGLMVWQDFPFACARYPDYDNYAETIRIEAIEAVKRLRNHPSLVLYCGNNENHWGYHSWWGGPEKAGPCWGEALYHKVLPEVLRCEDGKVPYWPGSPYRGDDPNSESIGDRHNWDVWAQSGDWRAYNKDQGRFLSEFGFLAPPTQKTIEKYTELGDRTLSSPVMRWHHKSGKKYDDYLSYIAYQYPKPEKVEDLIYFGELNQAEALKYGIEHWRRQKFHCGGTLIWQINDCWPVQSWSLIDSDLNPKASFYYAKRFFAPVLLSMIREEDTVDIYLTNGLLHSVEGVLTLRVVDVGGKLLFSHSEPTNLQANSSKSILRRRLSEDILRQSASVILTASFEGEQYTENFMLLVSPKEMRTPAPRLSFNVIKKEPEGKYNLILESESVVLSLYVWFEGLELSLSDNYFHLIPGRRKEISLKVSGEFTETKITSALRWRSL